MVPRAADADQLGAAQGENDADESDDTAKDRGRPFGSTGWLSPIVKEDDVLQLTEHGIFGSGLIARLFSYRLKS